LDSVDAELQTKGFKISTDDPDFLVTARLGKKEKESEHILGIRSSGTFTRRREHSVVTSEIEVGSLILNFVDTKSKKIVWRGKAKAVIDEEKDSPERQEKLIKKAVSKILKNFTQTSK